MLSNEVRTFLTGIVSDQLIDVYERFINFLSEKEIFTFYYYILELIATRNNYETTEFVLRLNDIIASQVDAILIDFDIELSDEITVPESLVFLEAFFKIEHWDDQDRLQSLINNAESTEIALADVIAEISGISSGTILPWLKKVSPEVISNISSLTKSHDDESYIDLLPDDPVHYEKVKTKLKSYLAEYKEGVNVDEFMIKEGMRILTPYVRLLAGYISGNYIDLTEFSRMENPLLTGRKLINSISDNLIGLAIMSGEGSEEINRATTNVLTQIGLPERVVTELLSQVKDKSIKVNYDG